MCTFILKHCLVLVYAYLVVSSSSSTEGTGDIPFWLRVLLGFPLLLPASVLSVDRMDDFFEVRPLVAIIWSNSGPSGNSVSDTGLETSSGTAALLWHSVVGHGYNFVLQSTHGSSGELATKSKWLLRLSWRDRRCGGYDTTENWYGGGIGGPSGPKPIPSNT